MFLVGFTCFNWARTAAKRSRDKVVSERDIARHRVETAEANARAQAEAAKSEAHKGTADHANRHTLITADWRRRATRTH